MKLVRDTQAEGERYFIEFADGTCVSDTNGRPASFTHEEASRRLFHGNYEPAPTAVAPAKPPQVSKPEKAKEE